MNITSDLAWFHYLLKHYCYDSITISLNKGPLDHYPIILVK